MFKEGLLDGTLRQIRKFIPKAMFSFFQPYYHTLLSHAGALIYGFPSRSMKVIGVTGTKGKSTTVFLVTKILEEAPRQAQGDAGGVAAIGSLGFKIGEKEWPNILKMTMPGRFKLQKFLKQAKDAGCKYVVMEVTSEGIKQKRHLGIRFDCAVFTNLHKEHIESHGSLEEYIAAKQELFKVTSNIHVINADDPHVESFGNFSSRKKIFYGIQRGDIRAENIELSEMGSNFNVYGTHFKTHLAGQFNIYNCLSALAVGAVYGVDLPSMQPVLEKVKEIPGRMQYIQREPFAVVVDYAHTPESLVQVYQTLKSEIINSKLICILGAAGGGRDKWKRPEFGRIAAKYCDEIILTNEDPYDENPDGIVRDIMSGFSNDELKMKNVKVIMDRREAIQTALTTHKNGDTVVITGKGSETSMALANGKKIPWLDADVVRETLKK